MVYLIHFDQPLAHALHYIGFAESSLKARIKKHRSGQGARLLAALNRAGIGWKVVRLWEEGDRTFERKLKNRKKTKDICPCCNKSIKHLTYKNKL